MRKGRVALAVLAIASAASGCVSSGPISGQLVVPNQPAERVTMTYRTDRFDTGGTLSVTLPSGEHFSGRYVQVTSSSTVDTVGPTWASWGPMWTDWGPFGQTWVTGPSDVFSFRTNYSGKVVATLFGDRGGVMRCRFNLVNPPSGMPDGGTGECQLSTGGKIDAQF
jgi:hypothetical protein